MNKIISRAMIFCFPYLIWATLVVVVDPFNYFDLCHWIPLEIKKRTSYELDPGLWKAIEFKRRPVGNLLLGDSRTERYDVERIRQVTGKEFYNFAIPGATLPEIIETFAYARRFVVPTSVYLGINFDLYNAYSSRRGFFRAAAISDNMLSYLFDRTVARAIYYNLMTYLAHREYRIGRTDLDKNAFWQYQLTYSAASNFQNYAYPTEYYRLLKELAGYCGSHRIPLTFFIPPTHVELQQRVADFALTAEEHRFKDDLSTLAPVIDLNIPSELTDDRAHFRDPYHIEAAVQDRVINRVWGDSAHRPVLTATGSR